VTTFLKETISKLDLLAWILVLVFFCGSALLFGGNVILATAGAVGVVLEMLLIGVAIEIIIESLKNTKGIGTITGFITNGPEAVCLLVGLLVGDVIFAASTPLGSNFMNPLLLCIAAGITGQVALVFRTKRLYTIATILLTAGLAGTFFKLQPSQYTLWVLFSLLLTSVLFFLRPKEQESSEPEDFSFKPGHWLIPSVALLILAGYFLDPVVSFTAQHSMAPKGVIGFVVLATLTSWPEFKSCLVLLKKRKPLAAILNITVSNITNIWLAVIGAATFVLTR
jgi:cation:H+ antiporter